MPHELVAGRGRRVACRDAEDSEVQCAETVAPCGGEQGMGVVASGAVGAVAERGCLVAADGVVEIKMPCGQHMQHHGQEAVGTGGIGQRVVLRTRLGKGAVVPSVGQFTFAHRIVKGAVGLPDHRKMEINGTVTFLGIRQYHLHSRVARQRMVVVVVWQSGGCNGVVPCAVGRSADRQVQRHCAVAAVSIGGGIECYSGSGVDRVVPYELVASHRRCIAAAHVVHSETERSGTVTPEDRSACHSVGAVMCSRCQCGIAPREGELTGAEGQGVG